MRSVCLILALLGVYPTCAFAQAAWDTFEQAKEAEKKGDVVKAYLLYSQAAAEDPGNAKYWAHSQALRRDAILEAKPPLTPSQVPPGDIAPEDDPAAGTISEDELEETRKPQPPRELKADPGQKSFDLKNNAKALFEHVARAYGLDVVFDGDYQANNQIRFRIDDASYREALHALEAATGSFLVPVSERLMLVVKDTPQKRQETEPTVAVTVAVPNTVAIQEAQEITRNLQQAMEIQKILLDSSRRLILIRDRMSKVYPAEQVLQQLLGYSGQVMVEVEFIAVNKRSNLAYGLHLPTSFPLVNFGNAAPSIPAGFARFLTFGGGMTFMGLGIADAQLFATMSKSSANTLLRSELRSLDGKPATLHVGDKFPILTAGYFGDTGGDSGQTFTPPPTFNFEDLGVVMKITPFVHGSDEITLEVEAEYKVLTGSVTNGIPIIANRKFTSRVRLKQGEWAVMSGLVSASDSRSFSGLAGVATLPIIGPFLRENNKNSESSDILLVIKPHLLALPPGDGGTKPIWVGSETRPLTQL